MAQVRTGSLDTLVRFERPVAAAGPRGAGKGTWEAVATEWANVQDKLPSRSEQSEEGFSSSANPSRLRIRYRLGISTAMRVVIGSLDQPDDPPPADRRVMQLVSGPAVVGRMEALEFMMVEFGLEGGTT